MNYDQSENVPDPVRLPTVTSRCVLETARLLVREWHAPASGEWPPVDLIACLPSILTPKVTAALPPDWQGEYSKERSQQWLDARDRESTNLLVVERETLAPLGLLLLFEVPAAAKDRVDVRLGYLMAQTSWGKGFGSELIQGFVQWCRGQAIASIEGGVARDNPASRRVLEKSGFDLIGTDDDSQDELFYRLQF
jgi:ribosomal-protein-alanine N-acetyltransferase